MANKDDFAGELLAGLFKAVGKLIVLIIKLGIKYPRSSGLIIAAGAACWWDWQATCLITGITAAVLLVGLSVWYAAHRSTFDRWVLPIARTWWRKWATYRRRWRLVMYRCGLTVEDEKKGTQVPTLRKVATTPYWDHLDVKLQIGQAPGDYEEQTDRLIHAFGAERGTVRKLHPGLIRLSMMRADPFLSVPVPAAAMPARTEEIVWSALPIGLTEYLDPFTVSLPGGHTSCAGGPGAGKAGIEWNIFRSIAPAIADGTARLALIDPKAKELRRIAHLAFALDVDKEVEEAPEKGSARQRPVKSTRKERRQAYAVKPQETLELLLALVREMNEANEADALSGERDFVPSRKRPLTLISIDELAPLLKLWDPAIVRRIEQALELLLSQGRAAGYIVIGCVQEPTKDTFTVRDLFARRLCLRVPKPSHTDAALIDDSVEFGGRSHEIPEEMPGVGFSLLSGASSVVRFRLGWVRDRDIDEFVAYVEQLRTSAGGNVIELSEKRPAIAAA